MRFIAAENRREPPEIELAVWFAESCQVSWLAVLTTTGMRIGVCVLLVVLGCRSTAPSAPRAPAPAPARAAEEIVALERARLEALGRADADALAPMFHPDLVVTLDSLVRTRDQILERMREQAKSGLVIDETGDDIVVRVYGDAAVATGVAVTVAPDGVTKRARFTSTWIWSDGRWRIVSGHVSPAAAP